MKEHVLCFIPGVVVGGGGVPEKITNKQTNQTQVFYIVTV